MVTCSVIKCDSRRTHVSMRRTPQAAADNVRFFVIPAWKQHHGAQMAQLTRRRRMAWISALGREELTFDKLSKHSRVCSRHFHKGEPAMEMLESDPDWAPSLHLGHTRMEASSFGQLDGMNEREQAAVLSNTKMDDTEEEDEDTLHMVGCKEEEGWRSWSPSLLQEEPEPPPPHIKEEQDELLLRPEEPDGSTLTSPAVKEEEDDDEDVSSHCSEIEVELESDSEVTEDSDEWEETSGGDESSSDASAGATGARSPSSAAAAARRGVQRVAWETVQQQHNSARDTPTWHGALPTASRVREPIEYFRDFFDADLLDGIVEQSNLYCRQTTSPTKALQLDRNELEQFIGTLVYMSIVRVPRTRMYWSNECRIAQVADVMSRDRWVEIKKFIHFNDNGNMAANNDDKLFKIRPVVDSLLRKCQGLPLDQMLSVDEQMVPLKGPKHIPKKPHTWGYKIFVLRDTKGLVYSFDIYTGRIKPAPGEPDNDIGANGNIVLRLAQIIPGGVNHLLYFDKWFSSMDLFVALANKGIPAIGTMQEDRLQGCSFSSDMDFKKKGRVTFEEKKVVVDDGVEIRAAKSLFDNRALIVASSFASAQPVCTIRMRERKSKRTVETECTSIISLYNKFVGGGGDDSLDAPIAKYRIRIGSKKYYQRLFFHLVDMMIANGLLLYRRDCESLDVPRKKRKDLLDFRSSVAQALCMQGKDLSRRKRGQPFSFVERECERKKHRGPVKAIPTLEVRTDAVGHWPMVDGSRKRCKYPTCKGKSNFKCSKCNLHLCLNSKINCFRDFHK